MMSKEKKLAIVEEYAAGVTPAQMARQFNISITAITTFYSKYRLNITLPPKEKTSKSTIDAFTILKLKELALKNGSGRVRRITATMKNL